MDFPTWVDVKYELEWLAVEDVLNQPLQDGQSPVLDSVPTTFLTPTIEPSTTRG